MSGSLIAELKRRNVFRVAAAYGVVAWLLIQVSTTVLPLFGAPDWITRVTPPCMLIGSYGNPAPRQNIRMEISP